MFLPLKEHLTTKNHWTRCPLQNNTRSLEFSYRDKFNNNNEGSRSLKHLQISAIKDHKNFKTPHFALITVTHVQGKSYKVRSCENGPFVVQQTATCWFRDRQAGDAKFPIHSFVELGPFSRVRKPHLSFWLPWQLGDKKKILRTNT